MDALNFHAALGDHVASDRRVDTARQQHRRTSARTCGKTACTGNGGTVDIGRCLADLDVHNVAGIVHIDRDVREFFCNPAANFLGDLDGVEGEALIGALGLDLEALLHGKLVSEVLYNGFENRVQVLFTGAAAAHRRNAENRAAGLPRAVQVAVIVQRLDIKGRLRDRDLKLAKLRHTPAGIGFELVFKDAAVLSLEDDFAKLQQKKFFHKRYPIFIIKYFLNSDHPART